MANDLFRKKSIDRINSPEQMNDYMHVASPGIWLLLASVIILIIGGIIWAIFGKIDTRIPAAVIVDNNKTVCYFSESEISNVSSGMKVIISDKEYMIDSVSSNAIKLASDNYYISDILGKEGSVLVVEADINSDLPDGTYRAVIVTEEFVPAAFLIN